MARTRFGTSQLTESLAGLVILLSRDVRPWHRDWHDAHAAAFRTRLAEDPVGTALLGHAFGATWTADFLTVPPTAPDLVLDEELQYLESLDDRRIRADLEFVAGPLPSVLSATGLSATAAGLLRWVWEHTICDEWER